MKAAAVVPLLLLTSCLWQRLERPPLGGRGGGDVTPAGSSAGNAGMSQKTVGGKEDPATIIAIDGSRCVVTQDRYREITIGERVWCVWITGR